MKITSENDICISVELTDDDMKNLDITYDELDYSNIETRRVLWTVLDEARRVSGKDISLSDKLIIETKPSKKGGCIIYFTSVPSEKRFKSEKLHILNNRNDIVCDFQSADDMLDFLEKTNGNSLFGDMKIYRDNNDYRIIIVSDTVHSDKIIAVCDEFGNCRRDFDGRICAFTKEHWQNISEKKL